MTTKNDFTLVFLSSKWMNMSCKHNLFIRLSTSSKSHLTTQESKRKLILAIYSQWKRRNSLGKIFPYHPIQIFRRHSRVPPVIHTDSLGKNLKISSNSIKSPKHVQQRQRPAQFAFSVMQTHETPGLHISPSIVRVVTSCLHLPCA